MFRQPVLQSIAKGYYATFELVMPVIFHASTVTLSAVESHFLNSEGANSDVEQRQDGRHSLFCLVVLPN